MDTDLLVVGLGASAGGIQALRQFFEHVPPDSGMAYVVILHLSPDHDSRLAEVLQHSAAIPVTQVRTRVRVQPDHVYVIPPNQSLSMLDGCLELSDMTRIEERRVPVDIFFRTLAESHRSRAVAVVLSGTGANGSMGLKRVKEQGGICLVQDPAEAEFDDMPRHSIATGLVDDVLPVAEIPGRILEYKESLPNLDLHDQTTEPPISAEQALRDMFVQLRRRTGHDFSNYKRATVLRRMARRMGIQQVPDLSAYSAFLREQPDEADALLKDLLISVTNFFRDREVFEQLERDLIPKLFEGKGEDAQVRVWVAGCATGEEAYSLAMLLAEHAWSTAASPSIQVFATDIDATAIAIAREGAYTLNDAADVSPERLARFFTTAGRIYRVRKELREMVLFAQHNLIKDPPFSHLDLVSCRNLLIYLNRTAQQRVMQTVHFALNPGGFFLLGSSESAEGSTELFATVDKDAHLYQSEPAAARTGLPVLDLSVAIREDPPGAGARDPEAHGRDRVSASDAHRRLLEAYAPPSIVVSEDFEIVHLSDRAARYLQYAGGDPTHNVLKAVRGELRLELRTALYQAAQRRTEVEARGIPVSIDGHTTLVDLVVRPALRDDRAVRGLFLILFEEGPRGTEARPAPAVSAVDVGDPAQQLEHELLRVKGQLRDAVERHETQAEELKASNEELQAMNEELRSAAEELETAKEELQSLNEELRTLNQELQTKVDEQTQAADDIQNLINSAEIGTIFVDRSGRIKLFTPKAREVFNLMPADRGRPLSEVKSLLVNEDLHLDVDRVLDTLNRVEREVRTREGKWHLMRAVPYRTVADRIAGVVLTFVDITERKRGEEELLQVKDALAAELSAMSLLHEVSTRLLEGGELEALLEQVLIAAVKVQDAEFGSIQLYDPVSSSLRTVARHGAAGRIVPDRQPQRETGTASAALEGGQCIIIEDMDLHPDYAQDRALAGAVGCRAAQHTPLFSRRGEPLGVLSTYSRQPRRPSAQELRLLDLYAREAAAVLEFTSGQQALRESEARLRRALEIDTVAVLFFTDDGTITYANDTFLLMSGYSRAELGGPGRQTPGVREWIAGSLTALQEPGRTGVEPYEKEVRPQGWDARMGPLRGHTFRRPRSRGVRDRSDSRQARAGTASVNRGAAAADRRQCHRLRHLHAGRGRPHRHLESRRGEDVRIHGSGGHRPARGDHLHTGGSGVRRSTG